MIPGHIPETRLPEKKCPNDILPVEEVPRKEFPRTTFYQKKNAQKTFCPKKKAFRSLMYSPKIISSLCDASFNLYFCKMKSPTMEVLCCII